MSGPVTSEPFHALAIALREGGHTAPADRLESILAATWTTSSELVAELGTAVLEIRRESKPLSSQQTALVKDCLREELSLNGQGPRGHRATTLRYTSMPAISMRSAG
jgi:hypothetical protein